MESCRDFGGKIAGSGSLFSLSKSLDSNHGLAHSLCFWCLDRTHGSARTLRLLTCAICLIALPFFALALGLVVFGILGAVVMRFRSLAPVHPLTLASFIGAALVATLVCATIYRRFVGTNGELKSRGAVIFFLLGSLVVATISGAVTAKLISRSVPRS